MPLDEPARAADVTDPVSDAVARAVLPAGRDADAVAAAEACFADASLPEAAALAAMLDLVARDPASERIQLLAARLVERLEGRAGSMPAWRGVLSRFPRCAEAMMVCLRWTQRHEGPGRAAMLLAQAFPDPPETPAEMLLLARALDELGEQELAEAAFARLARAHPAYEAGWLLRAQVEERRGRPWRAAEVIEDAIRKAGPRPRLAALAQRLSGELRQLDLLVPPAERRGRDVGSLVLARLAARAAEGRGAPPPMPDALGPVVLVGSSLGAGGAERQMVNTALGLAAAAREGRRIAGRQPGAVRVICRALDERPGGAFFRPALEGAGVALSCYAALPEFGGRPDASAAAGLRDALRFLSPRVAEATARLTDELRAAAPAVVHLWQDGTILAGALAALLAGVPRIVLSVRTAPPQDRPERASPDHDALYPLLARIPGVTWTANSHFAATRYAACLGMEAGRIRVIPNGLAPLRTAASPATRAMAGHLAARAGGDGPLIGAVIRFDENKRPFLMLDCAALLLARRPDARFVLVGDGPLREAAEARAAALGIAGRVLFTGRSADVGFWLSRMDALLLLSRIEGLPNALLEAQQAGVPVVTTPAGGAPEALRDGETGFVLASAAAPSAEEAVAALLRIIASGGRRGAMARAARRFATERFGLERMLEGTVESYVC